MASTIQKEFKHGFTTISNDVLKDKTLSMKARGLLLTLMSLPEDRNFSIEGIASLLPDGVTSVRTAVRELEDAGYLERVRERDHGKIIGSRWIIHPRGKGEE